jgi:hypothetical protein
MAASRYRHVKCGTVPGGSFKPKTASSEGPYGDLIPCVWSVCHEHSYNCTAEHSELQGGAIANRCHSIVKLPFPLTPQFKSMLQSGVGTRDLDVRWVSSLSWYFLTLFGLQPVYNFILGSNNCTYPPSCKQSSELGTADNPPSCQPGNATNGHVQSRRWRNGSRAGS